MAGRLNANNAVDYLFNVHMMCQVAEAVRMCGFSVFVPCIDLVMGIIFGYEEYENYFDNSQPWIDVSEAVMLVPGWRPSPGTRREIKRAAKNKIPCFTGMEELLAHFGIDMENKREAIKKFANVKYKTLRHGAVNS